jgi:acetylglutamate/LysW-gamma-L-alpha-aminoadipate kinase
VPVISPPGVTPRGELINADADRIAAQIAVAMKAETLVLLTNVPGLLRDPSDPSSLISEVPRDRLSSFQDFAYGRMKKKLIAAGEALEGGVKRVVIASSLQPDPVERALDGMGTVIA